MRKTIEFANNLLPIHKFQNGTDRSVVIDFSRYNFQKQHFPKASRRDWKNWQWQIQNSITDLEMLDRILPLTPTEKTELQSLKVKLPLRITPYYAGLIANLGKNHPLRKTVIPSLNELKMSFGEAADPLHEEDDKKAPGLVHRYPDRVLVLLTDFCSANCRYCTRSRLVGQEHTVFDFDKVVSYISEHTEIRDVLLSGGDPLTLSDSKLEYYIQKIRAIEHVEMIRIGTKIPAVLPQRITPQLVNMLKKYHPLYLSIHFTHPDELTPETQAACRLLADAGIPLGSQTVLLKDVNDSAETLKKLFHELLKVRVKPYYLYQCDPISGSAHFRTSVDKGLQIMENLRGFTTGYAIPTYVIDAPGGGGKIPLQPKYQIDENADYVFLKNYEKNIYAYPKKK
ncbi:MAG: KamA family radical SAM protein [Candidatus Cloacimonadales bacterium]|nr:KamA family radical SAM protein [Candidatus Cloacimonadales bacterium]